MIEGRDINHLMVTSDLPAFEFLTYKGVFSLCCEQVNKNPSHKGVCLAVMLHLSKQSK